MKCSFESTATTCPASSWAKPMAASRANHPSYRSRANTNLNASLTTSLASW